MNFRRGVKENYIFWSEKGSGTRELSCTPPQTRGWGSGGEEQKEGLWKDAIKYEARARESTLSKIHVSRIPP